MTKEQEELLAEARRRYPVGTVFKSTHQGSIVTRKSGEHWDDVVNSSINVIWNGRSHNGEGWLYKNGIWAEIISTPKVEEPEYLIFN